MGIYEAQFLGLENAGARVWFTEGQPVPDCDVVITSPTPPHERDVELVLKHTRAPVVLYVPPSELWLDRKKLTRMSERLLFVYSTSRSKITEDGYAELGIPFLYLPFGADPRMMRPLALPPIYDVAFVGGLSHRRGYEPFIEPLLKRLGRRPALFVGPGWERYGIPGQLVAYGELLNVIYNLARVCINFHSAEQKRGEQVHVDLNNRVFDLAMAGCVQVSDNTEGLRWHFREDEVIMAESPKEWVDRVLTLIEAPEEQRQGIRQRARRRALADHTWDQRGRQLLDFIYSRLAAAEGTLARKNPSSRLRWLRSLFID